MEKEKENAQEEVLENGDISNNDEKNDLEHEQIQEEKLARIEEDRVRLAQLEAQQKFDREEAAKMLLATEGLEAAEVIKATATVGGDEAKIKKSLLKTTY